MKTKLILMLGLIVGFAVSCTNDEDLSKNPDGKGTVSFLVTDAPFPTDLVAEANVTIDKIEIRKADESEGEDSEGSTFVIVSEETMEFNLLDLRNGVTAELTNVELDAGSYDQIRLHVVDASVVLSDEASTTFDLKIPSGSSSGLKIKIKDGLIVQDGGFSTVLLDFDVSQSFVVQGNPLTKAGIKGFIFKPVIRAVVEEATGSIEGHITVGDSLAIGSATVEFYEMDSLITSALTDSTGFYAAIGLSLGEYDLKVLADGYVEAEEEVVAVTSTNAVVVDFELTPLVED
ncbi:DUF4382 domain-containing protein [uncultured Sunxiuqinia sp.]|uniref:DUF4382 domain-containing protein n=1 Tax=uncultured Sunxiuqinia sp. TaxID=1573825 RepID=UPI0030D862E5